MNGIIYKITNNINGKIYIGQTIRELEVRIKEHKRHKDTIMGKVFDKYGIDNFTIEIIDIADNIEELNDKEIYWISYYDSTNKDKGYNLCNGGDNTSGYKHTEKSKKKMSDNHPKYFGEDNHFYGKTHSEETRKIMSEKGKDNRANMRPVINLDTGEIFISIRRACEKYPHILPTHITRVCKGKRKRTGGYRWAYYEEVV